MGTRPERLALSRFIVEKLHTQTKSSAEVAAKTLPADVPPFNEKADQYMLLAWSNLGMYSISDSASWWMLRPPGNDISAVLIRRGEIPEMVTEGVELTYRVEPGLETPSTKVKFWDYSVPLLGKELPPDTGIAGNGLKGKMKFVEDRQGFIADRIPLIPYSDNHTFNPYPLVTIEAMDQSGGKILARTQVVAPVSTEMGCKNCHGGKWSKKGVPFNFSHP
jgi:hypothetical protein